LCLFLTLFCRISLNIKTNKNMTAQELLDNYANGERDFSGANVGGAKR